MVDCTTMMYYVVYIMCVLYCYVYAMVLYVYTICKYDVLYGDHGGLHFDALDHPLIVLRYMMQSSSYA